MGNEKVTWIKRSAAKTVRRVWCYDSMVSPVPFLDTVVVRCAGFAALSYKLGHVLEIESLNRGTFVTATYCSRVIWRGLGRQ